MPTLDSIEIAFPYEFYIQYFCAQGNGVDVVGATLVELSMGSHLDAVSVDTLECY